MPEPESIEVVPSVDTGNVPVDAPATPSEPSKEPVAPAVPEPVKPTEPAQPELYELPDGRKVDGVTVAQEYKNLLSDYTRKSQELAKVKPEILPDNKTTNPLADPNYIPPSYEELAKLIKQDTLRELEAKEQARVDQQRAVEDAVIGQLAEVKKVDANVNENALFLHATKYGFKDLKIAHQNMRDMAELAKTVQKTTAANIAKRDDPVSISPGATGLKPDRSNFASATDYLRSLK